MDKPKYYQNYHKHTSLSHRYNKDSSLTSSDYFEYMIDKFSSVPKIYSTVEHGWQGNYFKIYDDIEKINSHFNDKLINNKPNKFYKPNCKPIKFIFGTEAYWVKDRFEKDNTNCHIVLLAKNDNGRKKLNRAIYDSFKSGYYYKGRMDLDILLSLPKDDVFVTTACIAFWGYDKHKNEDKTKYYDESYKETTEVILKLNEHFTDFYLEVQPHDTSYQKSINKHIMKLHKEYNIPIIAATDSHIINEENIEERDDLLRSNGINYPDEDGCYSDYPELDELIRRFKLQGVLTRDESYEAINNTNKILDFEDIKLDRSLKVPIAKKYRNLSQEERNEIFKNILRREWKAQINDINKDKFDQYISEIKHDIKEIEDCNMADYFIDNYEIMQLGQKKYHGILTPSGRGSAVSMYLNKLLRFTKVDKVNSPVLMYSERFLTKERIIDSKTPPDIDHNVSEREPFLQAQRDIIGDEGTFDLLALGTLKYKSAFKMYARAYNLEPNLANNVTQGITKYENALKYIEEEDEKDLISIYDYVDEDKYGYLIEGCHKYMGIVDTLKVHTCGSTCYDGDVIEDIGVIMVKSASQGEDAKETFVAVIESGTIDAFGYLKQDYLIVDSIGLTYDIYKEIGMKPMSVNELLEVIDGDDVTWDIYKNGYTMCINQAEQPKSTQKVKVFMPKNISELTQWIAGIRPAFKTMYKIFENRKHFDYGIKAFDDLIQDEYCDSSFILYQEHLMKVLSFAGFEIGETYTIIKAISKKKDYIINNSKAKFIPNFAKAILATKETTDEMEAKRLAEQVWMIVQNSASYGFNCVNGNTKIMRSSSNCKYIPTIEEMYMIMNDSKYAKDNGHESLNWKYRKYGYGNALSMFDDSRVRENKIIDITPSGIRQTYEVKTESGKSIVCTSNHKFPTTNGEVELSNLNIGDMLYCIRKYEKGIPTYLDKIVSIEPYKIEQTYNLEMADPNHTFISENGLVTSNSAHAYCMAIDSITLAWQKAYYPLEFYEVTLQRYTDKGKKDRVSSLKQEMIRQGIQLNPIRFGDDNRKFSIDRENNIINQTMSSIKSMQKIVPSLMYEIGLKEYKNFFDILNKMKEFKINKKSLDILIKLNYFSQFGNSHKLIEQVKVYDELMIIYNKFKNGKQFKKDYASSLGIELSEIAECSDNETAKQFSKLDHNKLLKVFKNHYRTILAMIWLKYPYEPTTTLDSIGYEVELLGYTDLINKESDDNEYIVTHLEINQYGTPFITLYQLNSGEQETLKLSRACKKKKWFKEYPCKVGDILNCIIEAEEVGKYEEIDGKRKWVMTEEYQRVIDIYSIK